MLFNSYIFIFVFLPIALLGYYGINKLVGVTPGKLFLCLMSFVFYGYFNVSYLAIIFVSLIVNYCISFGLYAKRKNIESKDVSKKSLTEKMLFASGIVFNLGMLGYYKYYDFFIKNINAICKTDFVLKNIMLPLGISFFTFQQLSFIVDRYKKEAEHYNFVDYMSFVTFFPQLVAGPIVLHSELVPQFQNIKKFDSEKFSDGICMFVYGLAMKVLLADRLGLVADYSFENILCLDSLTAFLGAVTFAFELYFDFAGYSNMAIGLGKMFGIELPDNFNRPFAAANNKDTWKRWHITLGRFFRTYVYFPLGGSHKGFIRALINTMIVFILSGLWHGADWTFVLWGVMHGAGICINMIWSKCINGIRDSLKILSWKITHILCVLGNFIFFSISMVFFRSNNLTDAVEYFKRMFGGINYYYIRVTSEEMKYPELYPVLKAMEMKTYININHIYIGLYVVILFAAFILSQIRPCRERIKKVKKNGLYGLFISILFVWCIISFSGVSQFLYFNF